MADQNLNDDDDLLDDDLDNDNDSELKNDNDATPPKESDDDVIVEIEGEDAPPKDDGDGDGDTDEEREKIREQRRQERAERKQRAKERQDKVRRELESERTARRQLEERIALIERRSTGSELAQIDHAMNQTKQAHAHFKEQIRLGQEQNNGAMVADATEKMLLAQQRYSQLNNVKSAYQQRQQQPAPLDPSLVRHANSFMEKHTWYRTDGNDDDSTIVRTIDNKLAAEGWDPKTQEYWEELETRVKKYLPHRAGRGTVSSTDNKGAGKPKSVVAGSGRESASASGAPQKGVYRVSQARVQAMKEAGVWDDTEKRKEAIKRYRDYDNTNKGR